MKRIISNLVVAIIAFIIYYFTLPAFNLQSMGFYSYLFIVVTMFSLVNLSLGEIDKLKFSKRIKVSIGTNQKNKSLGGYLYIGFVCCFVLIFIVNFIYSPVFMSSKYASRIKINEETSFEEDIKEIKFNSLPLLDKDSSSKIGDRVMGQMSELVSQFEVSSLYTQINFNNDIIRVTPLEYASEIKWLTNRKKGVSGYITVNSTTGKSNLTKLEKGMKYMPSALFNEDLYRKLRFSYPTKVFAEESFEIDNE